MDQNIQVLASAIRSQYANKSIAEILTAVNAKMITIKSGVMYNARDLAADFGSQRNAEIMAALNAALDQASKPIDQGGNPVTKQQMAFLIMWLENDGIDLGHSQTRVEIPYWVQQNVITSDEKDKILSHSEVATYTATRNTFGRDVLAGEVQEAMDGIVAENAAEAKRLAVATKLQKASTALAAVVAQIHVWENGVAAEPTSDEIASIFESVIRL